MARFRTTKIGKFNVPTWALIVLNICAPILGIIIGSGVIDVMLSEPDAKSIISAVRPGQQKTAVISWPIGNFTGGQLSMVLDIGVNASIAKDVVVTVDIIDPEDAARSYTVSRVDVFDLRRSDGLMYSSRVVNLIPVLTNLRGAVRDFKVRRVTLRAKVDRKVPTSTSSGLVFVTSANVMGKAVLDPL